RLDLIDHTERRRVTLFGSIANDLRQAFIDHKNGKPPTLHMNITKSRVDCQRMRQSALAAANITERAYPRRLTIHLHQPIMDDMSRAVFRTKPYPAPHSRNVMLILRKKLLVKPKH